MSNLILASTAVAELPLTEKMTLLALQVGLILFAAKLGGMLAVRVKLPSVLGELAAGIVIGPWALGGIGFGSGLFQNGLFRGAELRAVAAATGSSPFAVTPELYGLCTIASVVLLFLSGIETVAPKNYNAPYLQLMASLSRILHVSSAYRRLLMCTSAESMKDFFSSKQKEKTT